MTRLISASVVFLLIFLTATSVFLNPLQASGIFKVVDVVPSGAQLLIGIGDSVTDMASFDCLDATSQACMVGETVQIPANQTHNHVVIVSFSLKKTGSPTGTLRAAIFALADPSSPSSAPVPHNGALALSDSGIVASSLTTTPTLYNLTFSDTQGKLVQAFGSWFYAALVGESGFFDGSNYVTLNTFTNDVYGGYTEYQVKDAGDGHAQLILQTPQDTQIRVYADIFSSAPPPCTGAACGANTTGLVNFVIILLIIFTPAIALYGASKSIFLMLLGFLIGSGIAASAGLVQQWLPILIGIAMLGYIWHGGMGGGRKGES